MSTAASPRRRGTADFVTLIIDLTPVHDGTGPAQLLDLVTGRSAATLSTWLAEQNSAFRDQVEVVAMDEFGGYKTAAADELPEATTVMDPFHVVALAALKLDLCRQRIQQLTQGHRGRNGDPLYGVRRTLRTRFPLLTSGQRARLEAVFAADDHLAIMVTWSVYQRIIAAYGHPDPPSRQDHDDRDHRRATPRRARCARCARRAGPAGPHPAPTSWRSSTTTPPTDPPRRSTAASKRYAETPWNFAT